MRLFAKTVLSAPPLLAALLVSAPLFAGPSPASLDKPFMVAAKEYQAGHYEEAARFYRIMRTDYAGTDWEAKASLYLARCYEKLGRDADRIEVLEKTAKAFPGKEEGFEAALEMGRLREESGETRAAMRWYASAAESTAGGAMAPLALVNLGALQRRLGLADEAAATYARLAAAYPESPFAMREAAGGRAAVLRSQGRYDEAAAAYAAVQAAQPKGSPAWIVAGFAMANTWFQGRSFDKAAKAYGDLAAQEPSEAARCLAYQGLALRAGGRVREARDAFQRLVDEHGDSMWADMGRQALKETVKAAEAPAVLPTPAP